MLFSSKVDCCMPISHLRLGLQHTTNVYSQQSIGDDLYLAESFYTGILPRMYRRKMLWHFCEDKMKESLD